MSSTRPISRLIAGAGVLALLLAVQAPAGQTNQPQSGEPRGGGTQIEVKVRIGAEPTPAQFRIWKATDLIGRTVKNPENQDLGKVEDLAIDPDRGRIAYAVLSFGGFLGVGDKFFAIPWSSFEPRTDVLVLNVAKDKLKTAQGFDKSHWPDMADMRWATATHAFFGQSPYWEDEREPRLAAHETPQPERATAGRIARASDLIGKRIDNPQGDELGKIHELGVDPDHARIAYAVLATGGFLGMGTDLYAVPWGALRIVDDKPAVLNVDKATLEQGPRFPKEQWPDVQDRSFLENIYSYYKVPPYWQTGKHENKHKGEDTHKGDEKHHAEP